MFLLVMDSRSPIVVEDKFHGNDTKIQNAKPSITPVMPLSLCSAPPLMGKDQSPLGERAKVRGK
jgi:hypothetical protein